MDPIYLSPKAYNYYISISAGSSILEDIVLNEVVI